MRVDKGLWVVREQFLLQVSQHDHVLSAGLADGLVHQLLVAEPTHVADASLSQLLVAKSTHVADESAISY